MLAWPSLTMVIFYDLFLSMITYWVVKILDILKIMLNRELIIHIPLDT